MGSHRVRTYRAAAALLIAVTIATAGGLRVERVEGVDMAPALQADDWLLVSRLAFATRMPYRRDIVVFNDDGHRRMLRVVGVGGDTVEIVQGVLWVGGLTADGQTHDAARDGKWRVPGGQVFLLGDNRACGRDSRDFGPVPIASLEGRVVFRLLPAARRGWL